MGLLLVVFVAACSSAEVSTPEFECKDHSQCKKDQECQAGTCVLADGDGDGYSRSRDCDDRSKLVHPGAPEICDGTDADCDGVIDDECLACDLRVPQDHPSIQDAIDASVDGDVVCVDPGTWTETIDFEGQEIHLLGPHGPGATIIDGQQMGVVVRFSQGEGPGSILEGFTVTGGESLSEAGILISGSAPTLRHLNIRDNHGDFHGGGLLVVNGSAPSLTNVRIEENTAYHGGGLYMDDVSTATMHNVRVAGNEAEQTGGGLMITHESTLELTNVVVAGNYSGNRSAGISLDGDANGRFSNVVVAGNTADLLGSGIWVFQANAELTNVAVVSNAAADGGGVMVEYDSPTTVEHSLLWHNTPMDISGFPDPVGFMGNISVDPEFLATPPADPESWDLHIAEWSPAHDTGSDDLQDPDGSPSDMGAYGGPGGAEWDLDMDGFPAWWQPGPYDHATYPALGWDCDDLDATVQPGHGC